MTMHWPNTVSGCQELLTAQDGEILQLRDALKASQAEGEQLKRRVSALQRLLFGSRRERFVNEVGENRTSESATPTAEEPSAPPPVEMSAPAPPQPPTTRPMPRRTSKGRQERVLDESFPREQVFHRLDERDVAPDLWNDPRSKRFFRFVREEVEFQEPRVRVIQHYQEVIVLEDEQTCQTQMVAASAPEPLIDRCGLGAGFLAYLVTSRFADHIPYYREEDILARIGYPIHRSTQWRWMRSLANTFAPLVELIRQRVMLSRVLGIDETPVPLICPDLARTRKAYLYAQYGDATQPYVYFQFASRKTAENVRRIVGDYQGYLQSDAYICYELITMVATNRIHGVGCWAHARRKFEPLMIAGPHPQAKWILTRIQELYDIEDRARNMTDEQRLPLGGAGHKIAQNIQKRWMSVFSAQ